MWIDDKLFCFTRLLSGEIEGFAAFSQATLLGHDDMAMLKERMENTSFIVLGPSVYAVNVSGHMKTFFDRLAVWLHMMRLAGKAGVTVATAAGYGLVEVQNNLGMMMTSLGVKIAGTLGSYGSLPGHLYDLDGAQSDARTLVDAAYPHVMGERAVTTDEYPGEVFAVMRHKKWYGAERGWAVLARYRVSVTVRYADESIIDEFRRLLRRTWPGRTISSS